MINRFTIVAMLVLIISVSIATGMGLYYLTLPSAPSLPKVPQHLEIASYGSYIVESVGLEFFVVGGLVQNNLTTNTRSINVTVTVRDFENKTMGIEVGHAELEIIKPGQRTPFEVYFLLPSLKDVLHHFELVAFGLPTNEGPVIGVRILNDSVFESFDPTTGYHSIVGEVLNSRSGKAISVKVICAYSDSEGNILAVSHTYVCPELEIGAGASFELTSKPHKINPASYELFVAVHHYEMLLLSNYVLLAILVTTFIAFIIYMKRRGW